MDTLALIDLVLAVTEMDRLTGAQPSAGLAAGAIASNKVRKMLSSFGGRILCASRARIGLGFKKHAGHVEEQRRSHCRRAGNHKFSSA
jgi:hypothetical protein